MDIQAIEQQLRESLTLAECQVTGDGSHLSIIAVGECFAEISRVKQQQLVYRLLQDMLADGSLHAVSIKTYTPDQWQRQRKLNMPL